VKKFLALLLVAGLFTFAGCKKKEPTKTPSKSAPPTSEQGPTGPTVSPTKTTGSTGSTK
jgi:predicted small lipoprotein YifL